MNFILLSKANLLGETTEMRLTSVSCYEQVIQVRVSKVHCAVMGAACYFRSVS